MQLENTRIMKKLIALLCMACVLKAGIGQTTYTRITEHYQNETSLIRIRIDDPMIINSEGGYGYKLKTAIPFTSFSIGWQASSTIHEAHSFTVVYKVHKPGSGWSQWKTDDGYTKPGQTATGAYFTDLFFGIDEWLHDSLEFYVHAPDGEIFTEMQLVLQDISSSIRIDAANQFLESGAKSCPEFPAIIPRSEWCGSYDACHNPTYTVTYRTPTHTVVHHGASPDSYTDGYAVVRSYWNYHVNTNGWSDIGYNYLFDKYGNFFQGRHNPNLPNQDVHAAHAGYANTYSIGLNFLGNSDAANTAPTESQIQKCCEFLAWWYDYKEFDPLSSASILNQDGTQWITLPRICGHKDVNPGGTTCPGNTLYALLPNIRSITQQIITDCSTPSDTEPPTTQIATDRQWYNSEFRAAFSDADNAGGSGVKHCFYQVMDYDGTEWRANASNGFFNDNFDEAIHSEWTILSGTWSINQAHLKQADQTSENTNIYANFTQQSGNVYLYHWKQKISGTGSNRRSGMHFFCSDATGSGRGDSYMIYLRADANTVQIYKYLNNSYSATGAWYITQPFTINADTWYDVKLILDTNTGIISLYIDNVLAATATDASPLTAGNSISLRTGGCETEYDDIKVYLSRSNSVSIVPASNAEADIRYQSPSHIEEAGRIRTLLIDNANNWSESIAKNIFVDWDLPTSIAMTESTWNTDDFQVNFTDEDALSGIEKRFYSVSDYNGERWTSNQNKGFLTNHFTDLIGNEWTMQTGTWEILSDALTQTDESLSNTNIYTYLQQDLSNRYLYEFDMKIEGSNANKRAGFHFFSDAPSMANRGNGYFVWFRLQSQDLEFYKVTDDVFSLEKYYNIDMSAGEWYRISIVYDRVTGETYVYMNNQLVGEYTDPEPYNTGNYISFRSGNSKLSIQNMKVYRSRYPEANIEIGTINDDIRFQNTSPELYSACISTVVSDSAKNLSEPNQIMLKTDWTPPTAVANVNDGISSDIDITENLSQLSANWATSYDPHSGVADYYYAIGTEPGGTQIVNWTSNGLTNSFTHTGLNLVAETIYYISVRSRNGAGLFSTVVTSDGVKAVIIPSCQSNISICANAPQFALQGATPTGGIYSGTGVTGGYFNPTAAGLGTHIITYTLNSQSCNFTVTVNPLPEMSCPENIFVTQSASAFLLDGALPAGGQYLYNEMSITEFDPASYGIGTYEITYRYEISSTGCFGSCLFFIYVYSETEVLCPDDFSTCLNEPAFTLEMATPPGGAYTINGEILSDFDPGYWGVGSHTVIYTYNNIDCDFILTVYDLPELICPEDIVISQDDDPIALSGAFPEGGSYEIEGTTLNMLAPNLFEPGVYNAVYSYTDPASNCTNTCMFTISVTQGVSSGTSIAQVYSLYPNPNHGEFIFRSNNLTGCQSISIICAGGKTIYESLLTDSPDNIVVMISLNVAPGVYFVKVICDQGSIIKKLFIE